ncbi:hypothetical protein [Kistimonas scapharcae]
MLANRVLLMRCGELLDGVEQGGIGYRFAQKAINIPVITLTPA